MSGLGIHYDRGVGHALLGRRIPDLEVTTDRGLERVFTLLHDARPVLLDLGASLDIAPLVRSRETHQRSLCGAWELPGTVPAPNAVLIRPDGYVAWVSTGTNEGLHEALTTWFGPPK